MNMTMAEREGLVFEGCTASNWREDEIEKIKKKAAEIRKLGFRAVIAQSTQREWGNGARVLMVEPAYNSYKWLKDNEKFTTEQLYVKRAEERCREIMEAAITGQKAHDEQVAKVKEMLLSKGFKLS